MAEVALVTEEVEEEAVEAEEASAVDEEASAVEVEVEVEEVVASGDEEVEVAEVSKVGIGVWSRLSEGAEKGDVGASLPYCSSLLQVEASSLGAAGVEAVDEEASEGTSQGRM